MKLYILVTYLVEIMCAFISHEEDLDWSSNPMEEDINVEDTKIGVNAFIVNPCLNMNSNNNLGLRLNRNFKVVKIEDDGIVEKVAKVGDELIKIGGRGVTSFDSFEEAMISLKFIVQCKGEINDLTNQDYQITFNRGYKNQFNYPESSPLEDKEKEFVEYEATFRSDQLPNFKVLYIYLYIYIYIYIYKL